MAERDVVYTALFGPAETLTSQPVPAAGTGVRWICFTDSPALRSEHWEVVVVEPRYPDDPVRSARHVKILGHRLLEGYERWLWLDSRVRLRRAPQTLLDEWLADADLALPVHDTRATVRDELREVLRLRLDAPFLLRRQRWAYERHAPEVLGERPYWTALLARRPTPQVQAAARAWMDDVLRFSRRDQVSVNAALRRTGVDVHAVTLPSLSSDVHEWAAREALHRRQRIRVWGRSGFRYPLWRDVLDRVVTAWPVNRLPSVVPRLRSRFGRG